MGKHWSVLFAGAASLAGFDAAAQSIGTGCNSYYPIRQQGAACSGPNVGFSMTRPDGVVVCCVAQPRSSVGDNTRGTIYGPSEGERIAAGLALGIEGVQLLAEIIALLSSQSGGGTSTAESPEARQYREQAARQERQLDGERAEGNRGASILNAGGLEAAKAGNYLTALGNFKRCRDMANGGLRDVCERNMAAMEAYLHLQQALALTAEGKTTEAFTEFAKARYRSDDAKRPDIAARIDAYRVALRNRVESLPKQQQKNVRQPTECLNVNGRLVCD